MLALVAGRASKLKASVCGGLSGALAVLVIVNVIPTAVVLFEMVASTGGWLLGTTITAKFCVALSGGKPLSTTITLNALVPICAGAGVQVKTPLVGLIVALVAAPAPRVKASWSPSESLATLVIVSVMPTAIV